MSFEISPPMDEWVGKCVGKWVDGGDGFGDQNSPILGCAIFKRVRLDSDMSSFSGLSYCVTTLTNIPHLLWNLNQSDVWCKLLVENTFKRRASHRTHTYHTFRDSENITGAYNTEKLKLRGEGKLSNLLVVWCVRVWLKNLLTADPLRSPHPPKHEVDFLICWGR